MAKLQFILLTVALCNLSFVSTDFTGEPKREVGLKDSDTLPGNKHKEKFSSSSSSEFVDNPRRLENTFPLHDTLQTDPGEQSAELFDHFTSSGSPGGKTTKMAKIREKDVIVEDTAEGNMTSVHLCCDQDETFSPDMMCQKSDTPIQIMFHSKDGAQLHDVLYNTLVGLPNCSLYNLSPSMNGFDDYFTVSSQGELTVGHPVSAGGSSPPFSVVPGDYCLLFPEPHIMEALVCFPEEQVQTVSTTYSRDFQRSVYPACLLVGSVFLLLTLLVYFLVPDLREETVARSFMCSIAMLATAQVLMVTGQWGIISLIHTPACIALGTLTHFSFLSAFLWLNVISIMVLRSLWRSGSPKASPRHLSPMFCRGLYGFGVAGLIALVALLRDLVPGLQGSALPRPRFAAVSCWFSKSDALVAYLLGPISVLLLSNLVCFCLAACKMFTLNKHSDRSKSHFSQYMKLFVLMGVSWIFEVISFFANAATEDSSWLPYLWVFFDMVNILQGVLIFVLFVCRPTVLRHLAIRLCGTAGCLAVDESDRDDAAPSSTVV